MKHNKIPVLIVTCFALVLSMWTFIIVSNIDSVIEERARDREENIEVKNDSINRHTNFYIDEQQVQCKAISKKTGKQCKSIMVNKETGYCYIHDPNIPTCAKDSCKMKVKERGMYCRYHKKSL